MTALEEIKKAIEGVGPLKVEFTPDCDEFNSIIAPINDDYDGTFFTVIGCGDKQDKLGGYMALAVNKLPELVSTLESLQRENGALKNLIDGDGCADPDKIDALFRRAEAAEAEVARLQAEIDRKSSMPGDHRYWEGRYRDEAAENEKLRETLEPFAKFAGGISELKQRAFLQILVCPEGDDHADNYGPHFIRARTALASTGGEHHAE